MHPKKNAMPATAAMKKPTQGPTHVRLKSNQMPNIGSVASATMHRPNHATESFGSIANAVGQQASPSAIKAVDRISRRVLNRIAIPAF